MPPPPAVKVTRSGNSKMLPVPADLARAAHADIGDSYTVEVLGDDIVYHRSSGQVAITGTGAGRVGVVPAGRALRMTGNASIAPLDTWDF